MLPTALGEKAVLPTALGEKAVLPTALGEKAVLPTALGKRAVLLDMLQFTEHFDITHLSTKSSSLTLL